MLSKYQITSRTIADFFLPRFCLNCNGQLNINQDIICPQCSSQLLPPNKRFINLEFNRKFKDERLISDFYSLYIFKEKSIIQKMVHSLKYDHNFHVGRFLGIKLAESIRDKNFHWKAELIIPVPLHALKKAERGYNQSNEIAKGISEVLNLKVIGKAIKRIKFTETQTHLNINERKENIRNAFIFNKRAKIAGKRIILVDDVITTGATITECARLLSKNGAEKIYALSIGIAE